MSTSKATVQAHEQCGTRAAFLDFFHGHGHAVVSSSPLVPGNDPTLLSPTPGMVQFKDVFLGKEAPPLQTARRVRSAACGPAASTTTSRTWATRRATTRSSRCWALQLRGLLQREAIRYAWEFITGRLGIPRERLWVTVYEEIDGAAEIC